MSLRARLLLAAAYLLITVVLVLEVPLALSVERRAISEFEAGALGNAAVIASQISGDVHSVRSTGAPGAASAKASIIRAAESRARAIGARILVVDSGGGVLADSAGIAISGAEYATPSRPEFSAALVGRRIDVRRRFSESVGNELLLVTVPVVDRGTVVGAVRVSESLATLGARVHRTWLGLAAIGASVVFVGLGLAWFLAASVARRIRLLEEAAVRLGRGDLEARADVSGPEEIKTLALSFNRMASRLSASLTSQRDFTANAAHQLRTPVTGLKLRLESIEQEGGRAAEDARKASAEADRLSGLIDDLLALAAASTGPSTPGARLDLSRELQAGIDRWEQAATRSGRTLQAAPSPGEVPVDAEERDVADILDNLIENSIRYTPEGALIQAEAGHRDGRPFLAVSDSGPGIPPEERERIFERFFRGAQGRKTGAGTGLGLAIVDELVRRWGGEVQLADGRTMRVEILFPVTARP
ncbi:MAG: ATP-binding protein [Actinomycetota bacterium]|nr:ATP-binding protein [Actinomycetota bacterium]